MNEERARNHKTAAKIIPARKNGCLRCGSECWRSDVDYCWECYKYERFKSK